MNRLLSVLPVVTGFDHSDLAISDDEQASLGYAEMIHPEAPPKRSSVLRESLQAYCKRDTEAEVRLFEALSK